MSAQEDTANSAARVKTCEKLLKEYPETEQAKTSQVDAALIASLPGTVEENVALIAQVSEQLRQHMKHKSNLIQSALCIVSGSYAAILRRGAAVPSGGSQSAAESLSLASSGHDTIFGITGAVIGDLLDNSVMDLSAGFYLGGVSELSLIHI